MTPFFGILGFGQKVRDWNRTEMVERWRRDYNDVRPHSAIGYETLSTLAKRSPATSPP